MQISAVICLRFLFIILQNLLFILRNVRLDFILCHRIFCQAVKTKQDHQNKASPDRRTLLLKPSFTIRMHCFGDCCRWVRYSSYCFRSLYILSVLCRRNEDKKSRNETSRVNSKCNGNDINAADEF